MSENKIRNGQVDTYIEALFGKPDFTKAFFNPDDGRWWTPIGNKYKLWRVDVVPVVTPRLPVSTLKTLTPALTSTLHNNYYTNQIHA